MGATGEVKAGAADNAALYRKVAFRFMPLIMVCYFFAFFDRINVGFAKAALQADLGLSNTAYGLGASLFVVGYVLFEVPSNMVLYRVGARRWIARIMLTWGLATAAMIFVTEAWHFYVLRFLIGSMEAGFAPGVLYFLTLWFPRQVRGRITSTLFVASSFAGVVGAPIAGVILEHADGFLGMTGWRWMFLFGGIPCIILAYVVLKRLQDRVVDAHWLSEAERATLAAAIDDEPKDKSHSLLSALCSPAFLLLSLVYFLMQCGAYGLNFWGPDLIRTAFGGLGATAIGFLSATPYVFAVISMLTWGYFADRCGHRIPFVVGCILLGAAGFAGAGLFPHSPLLAMLSIAAIGAGITASVPLFWALPPRILAGAGAASGIALVSSLGHMGGIVSPIMVGRVKDLTGSATPALFLISGLCVLGALLLAFASPKALRERERRD